MKRPLPLGPPPCGPDGPCVPIFNDIQVQLARVRGRVVERFGPRASCPTCPERRLVALGYGPDCHACRVRPIEAHHMRGDHSGPAVWRGPSAVNVIAKEGERIAAEVGLFEAGLCSRCLFGDGLLLGIVLTSIGVEP